MIKWRQDRRCGKDYPLPDGKPAQCNPDGPLGPKQAGPCCSEYGYCGGSPIHCECAKCIDYRKRKIFQNVISSEKMLWTFYSATSFLEKCRKVVLEKWFFKLGFFFWSTTFLQPEKMWIYSIKPPFFLVNHFSRTRFLEPDFSNHFSRTTFLQLSRKVVAE